MYKPIFICFYNKFRRGIGRMNIVVYYPKEKNDVAVLQEKVAKVHAQAVAGYLQHLNCPKEQKLKLLNKI